jgi:hypothetical protein
MLILIVRRNWRIDEAPAHLGARNLDRIVCRWALGFESNWRSDP